MGWTRRVAWQQDIVKGVPVASSGRALGTPPWQLGPLLPHSWRGGLAWPCSGVVGSVCGCQLSALCGGRTREGQALLWSRGHQERLLEGSGLGTEAQQLGKGMVEKRWVDAIHSTVGSGADWLGPRRPPQLRGACYPSAELLSCWVWGDRPMSP